MNEWEFWAAFIICIAATVGRWYWRSPKEKHERGRYAAVAVVLNASIAYSSAYMAYSLWKPQLLGQATDLCNSDSKRIDSERAELELIGSPPSFTYAQTCRMPKETSRALALDRWESVSKRWEVEARGLRIESSCFLRRGLGYVQAGALLFLVCLVILYSAAGRREEGEPADEKRHWPLVAGVSALAVVVLFLEAVGGWYLQQHRYYVEAANSFSGSRMLTERFLLYTTIVDGNVDKDVAIEFMKRSPESSDVENVNMVRARRGGGVRPADGADFGRAGRGGSASAELRDNGAACSRSGDLEARCQRAARDHGRRGPRRRPRHAGRSADARDDASGLHSNPDRDGHRSAGRPQRQGP